jgi:hypothetical protein
MTKRWLGYFLFAISFSVLSFIAFQSKFPVVFYRFDGTYLLITAEMQKKWSISGWNFTGNPLQGIGGLELPQHNLLDPGLWLAAHLAPSIGPTVAMTFYATLLACSIFWLAARLGLAPLPRVFAAWLGPLLALPYVYPPLGFEFLWGVPTYIVLIALDTAVIILFIDLGRGSSVADVVRFFAIAAACVYEFTLFPNFAPVSLVVLGFFGLVAVLMAASKHEVVVKLAAALVLGCITAAVFGPLIFGLYGFAKPTFFWSEFYPRLGAVRDVSFLTAPYSGWPAWIVYGAGLLGGLHASWRGGPEMRPLARGFIAFIAANLALASLMKDGWRGPRTAYIDVFIFPFYCTFAIYATTLAFDWLRSRLPAMRLHPRAGLVAACVLPWLVLIDYRPPPLERPLARNLNPFIWPPAETPITKFLADELSLHPGAAFRGRVASIAGSDFEPQWEHAPFITQHNYDAMNLVFSGNDHRMYGLWYYNIPTLFESNQFSSPFFHLVNARLLNAPGALDLRSYETQSIVNDRIMELLGVRYLISDKLLPERAPAVKHRFVEGRDLFVYSVPDTNLAGYSVTQTRRATNAQEVVSLLADPSLDLRDVAVLTTADDLPPLVRVSDSRLLVERGGYRIEAASTGASLLVLPIEYSHCLQPQWSSTAGAPSPRLLRVNLAMAAVLFTGEVKGRLTLRYGPLSSGCRIEDWREAEALRLDEAREWPALRR